MFYENRSPDTAPLTRIGNLPVYGTTIVVAAMVLGLVVAALLGEGAAMMLLGYSPERFWQHGEIWRGLTYLSVGSINFFTLFNLLFFYSFGSQCEQEMGRGRYFGFLGILVLAPVLLVTVLWLFGIPGFLYGSTHLSIGLVIAFATLYPNVEWFGGILMKFVAFGCLFLAVVGHLSNRDQFGLGATIVTAAVSFGYIRAIRAGIFESFSLTEFFRRKPKPKLKVLPSPSARGSRRESEATEEMDALLDKIAESGIGSLSAKERSRLEVVREELLKRDRR